MKSLVFNCINITQRDEAFVFNNIKLPNRYGIHELRLKIDTGAKGNTQSVSIFRRIFPEKLDADGFPNIKKQFINKKLIAYNGTLIKCFGNIKIPCQYNKSDWHVSTFHIVDVQGLAVLELPSLEQLKLITLHCTIKKEDAFQTPAATRINATKDLIYPDQFDKIGSMPGAVRLSVNKNIHSHIDAPRKTPIALKDYIKQELDNVVKNKIIRKVTKPTEWVPSLAYSHKKRWEFENLPISKTPKYSTQKTTPCNTDHKIAHDLLALNVCILDNQTGKCKPATITSRCAENRLYILQLPDGSSKRRNKVQIRAVETSSHKQVHLMTTPFHCKKDSRIQTTSHHREV